MHVRVCVSLFPFVQQLSVSRSQAPTQRRYVPSVLLEVLDVCVCRTGGGEQGAKRARERVCVCEQGIAGRSHVRYEVGGWILGGPCSFPFLAPFPLLGRPPPLASSR